MSKGGLILLLSLSWSSPASAGPTCAEWLRFSDAERKAGMAALLEQSLPKGLPPSTVTCLQSIQGQIADHSSELCKRDGGDFVPSATTAIATAIEYCQTR
jgi:hypothetical protein